VGEPVFLALLSVDRVIVENNGKKGLIGVFNRFRFPPLPARALTALIFFAASASLSRGSTAQIVVLPIGGEADSKDPGAEIELIVPIRSVSFPNP